MMVFSLEAKYELEALGVFKHVGIVLDTCEGKQEITEVYTNT